MLSSRFGLISTVVVVLGFGVVRAEHAVSLGSKEYSCRSGTACVEGNSSGGKTWGVYGAGTKADGVHGTTNTTGGDSGVAGISTNTSGHGNGVYGSSSNGPGVYGRTSLYGANGIEGHVGTGGYGVAGFAIYVATSSAAGIYGNGPNGVIGEGSGGGDGVVAIAEPSASSYSDSFYAYAPATTYGFACVIDSKANLTCTGDIVGGPAVKVTRKNAAGRKVLTYAKESASATIEDAGTARMFGGVANVQIAPDFSAVMDRSWYYVFVTPLGETRGLYVSMKTPKSFQVREVERGRDSLSFDYRIVAHPLGARNDRLPLAK